MKASATIDVERSRDRDVVVNRRSTSPFSVRQCGDRILLASSAAAPVGGDELELNIAVGAGATAAVGSVSASMVWPSPDQAWSYSATKCTVAHGGHLELHLEPTISVAKSRHRATTTIELAHDATCSVVEELVLGRTNEPSGHIDLSVRVVRDGVPLIHHSEAFGPEVAGALSSVSTGAARFVTMALVVGDASGDSSTSVKADEAVAWLRLADDAVMVLAVSHERLPVDGLLAEFSRADRQNSECRIVAD